MYNNQGLSKAYQPQTLADKPSLDFGYSGYHKKKLEKTVLRKHACWLGKNMHSRKKN